MAVPQQPLTGRAAARTEVPVGWALLRAEDDPTLALLTELGDSAPRVVQGYGGWEEIDRRGRTSLTDWTGFKPIAIELDLTLDDVDAGRSVEGAIDMLEGLAGRGRRTTGGEPPRVIVNTAGVMPFDERVNPDTRWVLNDLDFRDDDDDGTIVNHVGNRIRVDVTVSVLQHVSDNRLHDRALAARRRNQAAKKKGARRRYTVKSGDTLQSIARKQLGDAGRWLELAKLNGLRDPRSIKAGRILKLP